jgi:hypothetical protein
MGVVDKVYEYELITGLTDFQLRTLYTEARHQMKVRKLLIYDAKQDLYVPNLNPKQIYHGPKTQKESVNILINERSSESTQWEFTKKMTRQNPSIITQWLKEDWSHLWSENLDEQRRYYVYYHCDVESSPICFTNMVKNDLVKVNFVGTPFYIGKGTGDRYLSLHGRCSAHVQRIRFFESMGHTINSMSYVLIDGLTEREAFEIESKLIAFFGCMAEVPTSKRYFHGGSGGTLVNSDIGKRPDWIKKIISEMMGRAKESKASKNPSKSKRRKQNKRERLEMNNVIETCSANH